MVAAIRQRVKVQPGGVIQLRSRELKPGSQADVIVLVERRTKRSSAKSNGSSKRKPVKEVPIAKMTRQVRGDIRWAKRVLAEPGPNVPWEKIKKELGL